MPGQFESILDKLQAKLGKQTIRKASSIARPKPRPDVIRMQAINDFMKRNPRAGGGLLNGSSEEAAAAAFRKKVDELMDDGYDFGEAVREAMRQGYDKGGMVKLVEYVESLPKGTTVTLKMVQDYVKKNKLKVNIQNFFNRKAPKIKGKKFISDTRVKDLKLTDTEKANIEKYGKAKYDKLKTPTDKMRVRRGEDVGSLAPEKTQKVKFKKEYDKAIKYYKKKGVEPNIDSLRRNIARNKGKFKATGVKLRGEAGLSSVLKNYEKADLIKDLKKGKNLGEIAIEYFDKNEKQVLKTLEGKRDYTKPLGRISGELGNIVKKDKEAIKLYNKIVKANSFKKSKSVNKYVKDLETLLPFAQEQGLVPKVNTKGVKIDTASKYFQHAYKTKSEPISKLFGYFEKVGIEHPGGVTRAVIFNDPATLNEIVATMPDTNILSGSTYDKYATGQAQYYKRTGDSKYIKSLNKIINQKAKEFGKPRTILDVKKGKVVRRPTKFSLMKPDMFTDAKSYINEYIVAGGSKRDSFNKLDPTLQNAIKQYEKGNTVKGNQKLKQALNKVLGVAKPVVKVAGKILKPVGIATGLSAVNTALQAGERNPFDLAGAYITADPEVATTGRRIRQDPEFRTKYMADILSKPLDEGTYDAMDESFTSYFDGGIVSALKGVK